ncbi:MAG: TIGR04086 family membrane protein [Ruminiclostridium sp.]|nr:TIGR04086 family membrane protein [Ruminiclostridium sp.]
MRKSNLLHVLFGAALALGLSLLLVLGLSALIWSGTLPANTPTLSLTIAMGLCTFIGGRFAIRKGSASMVTGFTTGGVLVCVMALICLGVSGSVPFHGRFLATVMMVLAGGAFSGLLGRNKKKKQKQKKK